MNNKADLQVSRIGYGHYKVSALYYGKRWSVVSTNSQLVDDWNSEEKDGRVNRRLRGYRGLVRYVRDYARRVSL